MVACDLRWYQGCFGQEWHRPGRHRRHWYRWTELVCDPEIKKQIDQKHKASRFKFSPIPVYHNGLPMALEEETGFYK